MTESTLFGAVSLTIIVVLFVYSIGGAFFEAKKVHIIHETGLGILLGIFSGFLFLTLYPTSMDQLSDFNNELFFYILLPVIIFSGGYNLNKKRFFQNFKYINLFGLFGTIICFFFIVICTHFINEWDYIRKWDNFDQVIKLNIYQIMVFSATICATDSVAGLTMIKPEKHPKLFSVVFGEGMVNDAVAIIIFLAVGDLANSDGNKLEFEWWTTFQLLGQFLADFSASLLIGLFMGLFTTWLFKTLRFLTHSCILETAIILYMGYASFTICELTKLSGVISVLVTGIVLAHYNFYNISPIGKISSQVTLSTLSFVCEAAIYVYLGISVWTLWSTEGKPDKIWSWTFVLCELGITFLGRGFSMAFIAITMILVKGKRSWRLSIWEMIIIWFAGLIRGSIAYALIQQLNPSGPGDAGQIELLKNTTLIMVIITTIVLGGLMPLVININMRQQQKSQIAPLQLKASIRETLMGQVELPGETEQSKKYRSNFQRLVKRLDDKYIKPFLIHDFLKRKSEIERSKKMLKMNHQDFDPTQFGRNTIMVNQSLDHVNSKNQPSRESHRLTNEYMLAAHPDKQPLMSKIVMRSSYQSKFMGQQNFTFDFDMPLYEQQISQVPDTAHANDDDNDEYEDGSNLSSVQDKHTKSNEISISQMVSK